MGLRLCGEEAQRLGSHRDSREDLAPRGVPWLPPAIIDPGKSHLTLGGFFRGSSRGLDALDTLTGSLKFMPGLEWHHSFIHSIKNLEYRLEVNRQGLEDMAFVLSKNILYFY